VDIFPIASSSEANSTWIKSKEASILIDGGTTLKRITNSVENPTELDALFITHEHGDHINGAGAIGRKYKMPIYIHEYSFKSKEEKFNNCKIQYLKPSDTIKIKDLEITPFSTRHDCRYSFGFMVKDKEGSVLCYLTDTGIITSLMLSKVKESNILFIEADYDEEGLRKYADYSDDLKDRISGDFGHLSNQQTIKLLKMLDLEKYKLIVLGHLSKRTNSPETLTSLLETNFPKNKDLFKLAPTNKPISVI